jgi:hypothetical protein
VARAPSSRRLKEVLMIVHISSPAGTEIEGIFFEEV